MIKTFRQRQGKWKQRRFFSPFSLTVNLSYLTQSLDWIKWRYSRISDMFTGMWSHDQVQPRFFLVGKPQNRCWPRIPQKFQIAYLTKTFFQGLQMQWVTSCLWPLKKQDIRILFVLIKTTLLPDFANDGASTYNNQTYDFALTLFVYLLSYPVKSWAVQNLQHPIMAPSIPPNA